MKTEATPEASTEDVLHGLMLETVLSLPLLHRDTVAAGWRNQAPHLWPGLPHMPEAGYVALAGYPFSPQDAAACLADLEAMSVAGLSGVPLQALVACENRPQSVRDLDEQKALHHFATTGEDASAGAATEREDVLRHRAAQKVLLWAWLLEERQREVRDLTRSFAKGSSHLVDALGVEEDADMAALHAMDMQLGDDVGILPPWKLVLENAALFFPNVCSLIINDARMAEAVTENCVSALSGFKALETAVYADWNLHEQPRRVWAVGTLPLWAIVGLASAPEQRPWLNRTVRLILPVPATCIHGVETVA